MKRHLFFFVAVTLLLSLPAGYEPHHFAKALFVGALVHSFAYAGVMTLLSFGSQRLRQCLLGIVYVLFCLESYLFFCVGSRLDPNILVIMLQTSWREVGEFLSVYVLTPFSLLLLVVAILGYMGLRRLIFIRGAHDASPSRRWWIMMIVLTLSGMLVPFISLPFPLGKNTIHELAMSVSNVREWHSEVDKMAHSIDKIVITEAPSADLAPVVVFVIGESFNKQHSSLYGGPLPTSPHMEQERKAGNLWCFEHAVSPTNGTAFAMRFLFTLKGCEREDSADMRQYVLLPAVFRKAGFKVAYLDNQYTRSSGGSLDYSCGYFLNPNYIHDHCFDYRNTETQRYDGDFIDQYGKRLYLDNKSLNIIHLMGQHFDAKLRFPQSFCRFTGSDILRSDLTPSQRQQVADYENATLYNDEVLWKIINYFRTSNAVVVYLSDHGEQLYEGPEKYFGRGFGSSSDSVTFKAVHEVPLLIWCSDQFLQCHGEMKSILAQAVKRKVCTADIAYALFDLAGIRCNFHEPSRSILDSTYYPHPIQFAE